MARKLLCGFALMAGLAIAAGCGGSSSAPTKSREEIDKISKQSQDMQQKGQMTPPGGGATVPMAPEGEKK